ncbi:MAG TPA: hypothetical protein VIQ24_07400 [Pyrinomonadaceae bacterium]
MSDQNLLAEEGDRPIIIQGGGSVSINVPPNFTDQTGGENQQADGGKEKSFKNGNVNLVSLQIDENDPIPLNRTSKITIMYK